MRKNRQRAVSVPGTVIGGAVAITLLCAGLSGCTDDDGIDDQNNDDSSPPELVTDLPAPPADQLLDCDTVSPLPEGGITAVDTSRTPRPNRDAEYLALEASGKFLAPEGLYQRVVAELTGIRAKFPEVQDYSVSSCQEHLGLFSVTPQVYDKVQAGTYDAADQLNDTLHAKLHIRRKNGVSLDTDGRYNKQRLLKVYTALPGIEDFNSLSAPIGTSRRTDICLGRRGRVNRYIFFEDPGDEAWADPEVSDQISVRGFDVDEDGNITKLGVFTTDGPIEDDTKGLPEFYKQAEACREFLDTSLRTVIGMLGVPREII